MLIANAEVFDEIVSGTATEWLTSEMHNQMLGRPDWLIVFATAHDVSGSGPVVKVFLDRSADNQHWIQDPLSPLISDNLSDGMVATGQASNVTHRFRRLRVRLEGTSPGCRLKLHVTGRRP